MRYLAKLCFGAPRLNRLHRFRGDAGGVAAIEFAMVVPLMIAMFIGAVEFSQAITVDRRVSQVASSTADLIARTKTMDTTDMNGVMQVVAELMKPYDAAPMKLTVLNVAASPSNVTDTRVCWSHPHNGGVGTYSSGDPYTLPPGVVEAGDSVIVAEVAYAYTPLIFNHYITSVRDLTETFYLKPRLSSFVKYNNQSCP
ncbi:MAG: pilus assembly protein [Alphaproteobacteria bacterium]|nr:pilus assembly protein [Alphaproteobacteria bacterium]